VCFQVRQLLFLNGTVFFEDLVFIIHIQLIDGIKKGNDFQVIRLGISTHVQLEIAFFTLVKGFNQLEEFISRPVGHRKYLSAESFTAKGFKKKWLFYKA
jgi:hypothetical protein